MRHPSREGSRKSSPLGAGEADEEGRATTRVAPTSSIPSPLGGGPVLRLLRLRPSGATLRTNGGEGLSRRACPAPGRRRLEQITMLCSASLSPFRSAGWKPASGQDGRAPRQRESERPGAGETHPAATRHPSREGMGRTPAGASVKLSCREPKGRGGGVEAKPPNRFICLTRPGRGLCIFRHRGQRTLGWRAARFSLRGVGAPASSLPDECGLARLVQWLYLVLRF